MSDDTYRVIKPPKEIEELRGRALAHLGRSQKGVYFAFIDRKSCFWVWIFDDSCDKMEWTLRHRSVCGRLPTPQSNQESYGPWILTKVNNCGYGSILQDDANNRDESDSSEAPAEQELGWDSDDENILHTEKRTPEKLAGLTILGFHPCKEIVFFDKSSRGLAYHLKTSKLEDLGNLYPKGHIGFTGSVSCIESAFPYTPCWMGEL